MRVIYEIRCTLINNAAALAMWRDTVRLFAFRRLGCSSSRRYYPRENRDSSAGARCEKRIARKRLRRVRNRGRSHQSAIPCTDDEISAIRDRVSMLSRLST